MLFIATKVERIVLDASSMVESLGRGLLTLSALAPGLSVDVADDLPTPFGPATAASSERRAPDVAPSPPQVTAKLPGHKNGDLLVIGDLTELTYRYSNQTHDLQQELHARLSQLEGEFFGLSRGVDELAVVCGHAMVSVVGEVFNGETLLRRNPGLSAVSVPFNPARVRSPNMYTTIMRQLTANKIKVHNMVSTTSAMTLLIDPTDAAAAADLLSRMLG